MWNGIERRKTERREDYCPHHYEHERMLTTQGDKITRLCKVLDDKINFKTFAYVISGLCAIFMIILTILAGVAAERQESFNLRIKQQHDVLQRIEKDTNDIKWQIKNINDFIEDSKSHNK